VPIRLLAEQMIRLAGKQPGRDVAIVYTGLRPGEKLHETLFHADERYRPTQHPKILQAEPRKVPTAQVFDQIASFTDACARYDLVELAKLLRDAVPEFEPLDAREIRSANATVVAFPARQSRKI
jgi:FlaA1/EpsC-like NDP-sugar epimerase